MTSELPPWGHVRVTGYCLRVIACVGIRLHLSSFPPCVGLGNRSSWPRRRLLPYALHSSALLPSGRHVLAARALRASRYALCVSLSRLQGERCPLTYSRATRQGVERRDVGSASPSLVRTRRRVTNYHFAVGRVRRTSTVPFPLPPCRSSGSTAASRRPSPIGEACDRSYGVRALVTRGGCGLSRRARRKWYAGV